MNVWTFFTADCQKKPLAWRSQQDLSSSLDAVRASVNILKFWSTVNPRQRLFFNFAGSKNLLYNLWVATAKSLLRKGSA